MGLTTPDNNGNRSNGEAMERLPAAPENPAVIHSDEPYKGRLNRSAKCLAAKEEQMAQEERDHPGEIAARSLDGSVTHCYAATYEELRRLLRAEGIRRKDVVCSHIMPADEGEIF